MYKTVLILSLFFISRDSDDNNDTDDTSEISQEIKDLIYFKGNENAPVVLNKCV